MFVIDDIAGFLSALRHDNNAEDGSACFPVAMKMLIIE